MTEQLLHLQEGPTREPATVLIAHFRDKICLHECICELMCFANLNVYASPVLVLEQYCVGVFLMLG